MLEASAESKLAVLGSSLTQRTTCDLSLVLLTKIRGWTGESVLARSIEVMNVLYKAVIARNWTWVSQLDIVMDPRGKQAGSNIHKVVLITDLSPALQCFAGNVL